MDTNFSVIWNKIRRVWRVGCETVLGTSACEWGNRSTDARLAEALEEEEEKSLAWVKRQG